MVMFCFRACSHHGCGLPCHVVTVRRDLEGRPVESNQALTVEVCVYVCMCVYVCIVSVCVWMHVCIVCVCMCVCMCVCVWCVWCVCVFVCVQACVYVCTVCVCPCVWLFVFYVTQRAHSRMYSVFNNEKHPNGIGCAGHMHGMQASM